LVFHKSDFIYQLQLNDFFFHPPTGIPGFVNVFKRLGDKFDFSQLEPSDMLRTMAEIVSQYKPLPKASVNISVDEATELLELQYLSLAKSGQFERGVQEDASEFLTFLVNSLNTEMINAINCNLQTTLEQMFFGSTLNMTTDGKKREQFLSLPIDINYSKVTSIETALLRTFRAPNFNEGANTNSNYLHELPETFIMTLKVFSYERKNNRTKKSLKYVDLEDELTIPEIILSESGNSNYTDKRRQYRLAAVIYHIGYTLESGHYVTDAYHSGFKKWIHYNDSQVKFVESPSLQYNYENQTPYILLYRRKDTFGMAKSKPTKNPTVQKATETDKKESTKTSGYEISEYISVPVFEESSTRANQSKPKKNKNNKRKR